MNKQFEEWIDSRYQHDGIDTAEEWEKSFPASMKWGVYLEFFDSVGIQITITPYYKQGKSTLVWECHLKGISIDSETRKEAQKAAIEKATEILDGRN